MEYLRVKELLSEKGMTSKHLAEEIGVSTVTMSYIVNGSQFPKPSLLKKIAEALGVGLRDLFTEEEGMEPIYIKKEGGFVKIGEIRKAGSN